MAPTPARRAWPNVFVVLLCCVTPPLGLLAWVLGSEAERPAYLRSWWVRAGLALLALGSAPLIAVAVAAKVGLWPDPNPNPIGLGLLFAAAAALATACLAIGAVWVWWERREPVR
jgi:hypothetical protein